MPLQCIVKYKKCRAHQSILVVWIDKHIKYLKPRAGLSLRELLKFGLVVKLICQTVYQIHQTFDKCSVWRRRQFLNTSSHLTRHKAMSGIYVKSVLSHQMSDIVHSNPFIFISYVKYVMLLIKNGKQQLKIAKCIIGFDRRNPFLNYHWNHPVIVSKNQIRTRPTSLAHVVSKHQKS